MAGAFLHTYLYKGLNTKLTLSSLFKNDHIYLENASKYATVVSLAKKLQQKYTNLVVERKVWRAKKNLQQKYINHGLAVMQMILLFNKIQQQNEYGNLPYNDGCLAKVYIFSDLTNISKYLNCNLHEITDIFQNRRNLSQDIST